MTRLLMVDGPFVVFLKLKKNTKLVQNKIPFFLL